MKKLVLIFIGFLVVPFAFSAPDISVTSKDFESIQNSDRYRSTFAENPDEVDWVSRYRDEGQIPPRVIRVNLRGFSGPQEGELNLELNKDGSLIKSESRDIEVSSAVVSDPEAFVAPQSFEIDLNDTGDYAVSIEYRNGSSVSQKSFRINSFYRGLENVKSLSLSVNNSQVLENESVKINSDIEAEKGNGETFKPGNVEGRTKIYINDTLVRESNSVGSHSFRKSDINKQEWATEGEWRIEQHADRETAEVTFQVGKENQQNTRTEGFFAKILSFFGL